MTASVISEQRCARQGLLGLVRGLQSPGGQRLEAPRRNGAESYCEQRTSCEPCGGEGTMSTTPYVPKLPAAP